MTAAEWDDWIADLWAGATETDSPQTELDRCDLALARLRREVAPALRELADGNDAGTEVPGLFWNVFAELLRTLPAFPVPRGTSDDSPTACARLDAWYRWRERLDAAAGRVARMRTQEGVQGVVVQPR